MEENLISAKQQIPTHDGAFWSSLDIGLHTLKVKSNSLLVEVPFIS